MTGILEVTTTLETAEQAQAIARQLVESQLAACVQITGPMQSIYRWQGAVCEAEEYRCTAKTSEALLEEVMASIRSSHPYDVPEVLATEVIACSQDYAEWLRAQLKT